jgi:hypothetical protein
MNHTTPLGRLFIASAAALAVLASLTLPRAALADKVVPPTVPAALQVPAGNMAYLVGHAQGTQNYACTAGTSGNVWTFTGPQATLSGDNGQVIAMHFAVPGTTPPQPEWQANDGSAVVGHKVAAATVDATAIPWLLLSAASTSTGPGGGDRLSNTTYVQRVHTTGGLAPTTACNVGDTANVPYTADYYFYQVGD